MIKAVFFDIDGTLVSFKTHVVPKSTLHAIELLKKKRIKVFIATGRHRRSINNLGDLEFDGYVTLNGGYECLPVKDDVIYKHSIPDKDIELGTLPGKGRRVPLCLRTGRRDFYELYG